jgi:hypothetical protein
VRNATYFSFHLFILQVKKVTITSTKNSDEQDKEKQRENREPPLMDWKEENYYRVALPAAP